MTTVRSKLMFGFLAVAAALTASGCGGKEPLAAPDGGLLTGDFMPLKEGNSWKFRVTDSMGAVTTKTQTVMAAELVGGAGPHKDKTAFKLVTKKHEGMTSVDETDSWQGREGTLVVRYRELSYHAVNGVVEQEEYWEPAKLRVDESVDHTRTAASWLEIYKETKLPVGGVSSTVEQRDLWSVLYASQSVTVPAGTWNAIVLQKVAGTVKNYWFVPGIGKVKETGDQTEELMEYTVTP